MAEELENSAQEEIVSFDAIGMEDFSDFGTEQVAPEGGQSGEEEAVNSLNPPQGNEINEFSESEGAESVAEGNQGDQGEEPDATGTPNLYSSLASALKQDGVFSTLDLEKTKVEDVDGLIGAIKTEIQQNEYRDLSDDQKEYLEALRNGVPVQEYQEAKSIEAQINSVTDEHLVDNEELRQNIILQDFVNKGFSKERAETQTKLVFDSGNDLDIAKSALADIKSAATARIQQQLFDAQEAKKNQDAKIKAQRKKVKDGVYEATEIIKGMPINEDIKKAVYDSISKPVDQLENGTPLNKIMADRQKNPADFDIKLHYVYHITKGFTDFGKLTAEAKTNAVRDLDSLIKGNTFVPGAADSAAKILKDNDFGNIDMGSEIV